MRMYRTHRIEHRILLPFILLALAFGLLASPATLIWLGVGAIVIGGIVTAVRLKGTHRQIEPRKKPHE